MRVKIDYTTETRGLLRKKEHPKMHINVTFTEEEKHLIRELRIGDEGVFLRDMGLDTQKRPVAARVQDLVNGKVVDIFEDRSTAREFEEIAIGSLQNLKNYLESELAGNEAVDIEL